MTEAATIADRRGQAQAAREEAETRIEELVAERVTLALRSFEGDEKASARVSEIDEEITSLEHSKRLATDALSEIETMEREAESAAREAWRQELATEFDSLVSARSKALKRFEKALDSLEGAVDAVLETDDRQREIGMDLGLTDGHIASYNLTLKDRILTKLPGLLGVGPTTLYPEPLTGDSSASVFAMTLAESETRKQEDLRRAETERAEQEQLLQAIERREQIGRRRDQLLAGAGYSTAHPSQRPLIEDEVEQALAQEFGKEKE